MIHEPHDLHRLLRDYVAGRDVPCPRCGFNLRNTTAERCGECGAPLHLAIDGPRPIGWLIVAAAGIAAPLGFAATVAGPAWWQMGREVFRTIQRPYDERYGAWSRADWINAGVSTAIVAVALVSLRILAWRASCLANRRRRTRWLVACICLLSGITTVYGLIYAYRATYEHYERQFWM